MAAAAGPAGPAYLYDIISVQAKNPQLPPMIGQWDLNQVIHTGQPIAHNNLVHAKAVAAALNGAAATGDNPLFTADVAESARFRAMAVEAAHVTGHYAPVNMVDILMQINQRLDQIIAQQNHTTLRLDQLTASGQNQAIRSRNMLKSVSSDLNAVLAPVLKVNAGHGLVRAQAVANNIGVAPQAALVAPEAVPNVGDIPPAFNANIFEYRHQDILRLIIFYNDDFGIVPGDGIPLRIQKFRHFLLEA